MTVSRIYNSAEQQEAEEAVIAAYKKLIDISCNTVGSPVSVTIGSLDIMDIPLQGPTPRQLMTIPGLKELWERVNIIKQLGQ